MKRLLALSLICLSLVSVAEDKNEAETPSAENIPENKWPMVFDSANAEITIYQPQLDSFKGNSLTARAAVAVKKKGASNPVYCAVWIKAKTDIDKDSRTVTFKNYEITQVAVPDSSDKAKKALGEIIRKQFAQADLSMSLDSLLAMMENLEKQKKAKGAKIANPVPKFFFSTKPAVLVYIDGEPVPRDIGDGLAQIVNTEYLLLKDKADGKYYLNCAGRWLTADKLEGPWRAAPKVPEKVLAVGKKEIVSEDAADKSETVPLVFVSTVPAELIQCSGEPQLGQIPGTDLSYLKNSDNDIFRDEKTRKLYLLASGRWYTADTKEGPWSYISSDKLPADFKKNSRRIS